MDPMSFPGWDPVLLDLPGPVDLRWYGLTYIIGFLAGQWLLKRLARAGFLPIQEEQVMDLIFYSVIGTILGGRLGYVLFYEQGLLDPIKILKIYEGGLSFHGGLIGVSTALALFARRHKIKIGRVLDAAALSVTPGILAVRCANFINGELYGRVTDESSPFAMRFPTDEYVADEIGIRMIKQLQGGKRAEELQIQHVLGNVGFDRVVEEMPEAVQAGQGLEQLRRFEGVRWEDVKDAAPLRHPSQLYEGFGEGLLLGLVLWTVYAMTRRRPLPTWTYGGMFLFGYGVIRFAIEFFRQPDRQFRDASDDLGTVLFGLSMGQVLSSVMVLAGFLLTARGFVLHRAARREGVPA